MITTRMLAITALGLVLSTRALHGQDRSQSRDFQLGGDLPAVSALTGVAASDPKAIHTGPAVRQVLKWRLPHFGTGIVNADRDRTVGMTGADMIRATATAFGPPLKPAVEKPRTVTLPWGLRRAGEGFALTVSGLNIFVQRNSFKLLKSITI